MENFVLYEEIGQYDHAVVHKGRRKETINFVAIHCIDKSKRPEITNSVRLTHEISHPNIVQFQEWYETSNHLWLIVELCSGGSLKTVITQDEHLPESSVRTFGTDLVKGLHHIHSLGIIFSDLQPSRILLDGSGILKFANFSLARLENEDLEQVFAQFRETGETWSSTEVSKSIVDDDMPGLPPEYKIRGAPSYMAPEVLQSGAHSIASDLWSLGVVLYHMFTGQLPFTADNFTQLSEQILHHAPPPPKVKGPRMTSKPSPEFQNLLEGLMCKDVHDRIGWDVLVTHPFWQGALAELSHDLDVDDAITQSVRESVRQSLAQFTMNTGEGTEGITVRSSTTTVHHGGPSPLGQVKVMKGQGDGNFLTVPGDGQLLDQMDDDSTLRPLTAPGSGDVKVNFTISSRPHTAASDDGDNYLTKAKVACSPGSTLQQISETLEPPPADATVDMRALIYHPTDFSVTPVVDNPKIQKPVALKFDPKSLPFPAYSADKLQSLSSNERESHVSALMDHLTGQGKGAAQKRLHILHYTATLAGANSAIANLLTRRGLLLALAKQVKEANQVDLKYRFCRVLGIIAANTKEVQSSTNLTEVLSLLTELMRENINTAKVKVMVLPALGEVLYLVASQEDAMGGIVNDLWGVPPVTYTLLSRCLREGEDPIVLHLAAKIVENIAATQSTHAQKLATIEVALPLWHAYLHATGDALKITTITAIMRLTRHNTAVFQSVLEKAGTSKLYTAMTTPVTRVQQSVVTLFLALIVSTDTRSNRVTQEKEFCQHAMRLLESPSVVIRAKTFLVILEVIQCNRDAFLAACQNRLVMYIERDWRRQTPGGRSDVGGNMEYLSQCMELLINAIIQLLPEIMREILSALDSAAGRKHPSPAQIKQLRQCLPLIPVLQHTVTSHIFRPRIIDDGFMSSLGLILHHVKSIDSGNTHIQAATGAAGTEEFLHTVFAVVEAIAQHAILLTKHQTVIIEKILPSLSSLVASSFADTRALALRLFSEIATFFLQHVDVGGGKIKCDKLHRLIGDGLIPNYELLLLEADPVPSYALKLLLALVDQNAHYITYIQKYSLVPVLYQVLVDHQNNPISQTEQQIAGLLHILVTHRETNMKDLYELGLLKHFQSIFRDVARLCVSGEDSVDQQSATVMITTLLEVLHGILKYISDVVRKALQSKKSGVDKASKETEAAEALLLLNKPLMDHLTDLTHLMVYDDPDVADLAVKCQSLLVQLFGGEHPDAMTIDNMDCYSAALQHADPKRQKILLRIIKRLISTDKKHQQQMQQNGIKLAKTIEALVNVASSHAEVGIATLAAEILKCTGHL